MKKNRINNDAHKIPPYLHKIMQSGLMLFTYVSNIFFRLISYIKSFFHLHKTAITKFFIPFMIIACGYYACSASQKAILENISQIFAISDDIRAYYVDKPDYWGLDTASVIQNRIISKKFIHHGKIKLHNGMEIKIGSGEKAETVMPLTQTFDIVLSGLNKAQCISYAETPLQDENALKLYRLTIINKNGSYIFEWGGVRSLPIEKYATKDLCADQENTLIWSLK